MYVNGDHAAKIKAVTKRLLQIKKHEPLSKTIVFSQWAPILDLIGTACEGNGIEPVKLYSLSRKKRQTMLVCN
jgi:SNF2 family DNA or RNA helicase